MKVRLLNNQLALQRFYVLVKFTVKLLTMQSGNKICETKLANPTAEHNFDKLCNQIFRSGIDKVLNPLEFLKCT